MSSAILTVRELVEKASSDDWLKRCRAASNRLTPVYWLKLLTRDESCAVRYRARRTLSDINWPKEKNEERIVPHFTAMVGLNRDAFKHIQKEIFKQRKELNNRIDKCNHRPKPMTTGMKRNSPSHHRTELPHLGPAVCRYCNKSLGWKCRHSPVGFCRVKDGYCIHCGRPAIRHLGKFDPAIHDKSDPENIWFGKLAAWNLNPGYINHKKRERNG